MMMNRRHLLSLTATGVAVTVLGRYGVQPANAADTVRWVSPRGTIEVLDDFPFWVAKKFGYFGDIETVFEPGPSDSTATVKLVDQGSADVGYPAPGVFSLSIAQDIPLVSVFAMGAGDVFDFAFRKGEALKDVKELEGKTIVVGNESWRSITDPMLKAAGLDISTLKYASAGWPTWGTALKEGHGDAAMTWEGLRAQWKGQGLDFDYLLGQNFSKLPSNSFVIRRADFEDPGKKALYAKYMKGWAAGLEFSRRNPRAATQIVMEVFPTLESQMTPPVATEALMQSARVFGAREEERNGKWGFHILPAWQLFFDTAREIGQISTQIDAASVLSNDLVDEANDLDRDKIFADADGYALNADYTAVDVEAIKAAL